MNTKQLAREREALLQLYYQSNNSLEKEYLCQKISLVEAQLEDLEKTWQNFVTFSVTGKLR